MQARVRDYVAVLGLELMLDEAEGYAFLRSRPEAEDGPDTGLRPPRLVARRPLRAMAVAHVFGDVGSEPDAEHFQTLFDSLLGRTGSLGFAGIRAHAALSRSTISIRSP